VRNLFLKIFLWFWMTLLIIAVTLVSGIIMNRANQNMRRQTLTRMSLYLPLEAKQTTDIFENDGTVGLQEHLAHLRVVAELEPYFLTPDGKDALGRSLPPQVIALAQSANEVSPVFSKRGFRQNMASFKATGASGRTYTMVIALPSPSIGMLMKELGYQTLFGLLGIMVVGVAFCFFLARHIANPVVQVSAAAGRIADGWLDTRSEPSIRHRRDEIGRLADNFDRMAERIESLVHGQQRLFGDVSHELRSPLARLSVAEGLLRQCPPDEQPEYLDRIATEVENLDQLIGQLLTFARIDSRADMSRKEPVELSSLVQEVAVDGNFEAQAKGCAVTVESTDILTTGGAREQLRRAVENVVRNAIRYSPSGTAVGITICRESADSTAALIQVRDHGPGVPEDHLERIFLPFHRVPAGQGEPSGGAGLGLAITERIVLMYGGTVRAANAVGGGLIVELRLPLIA
jgi:signal transduction histidine kinase